MHPADDQGPRRDQAHGRQYPHYSSPPLLDEEVYLCSERVSATRQQQGSCLMCSPPRHGGSDRSRVCANESNGGHPMKRIILVVVGTIPRFPDGSGIRAKPRRSVTVSASANAQTVAETIDRVLAAAPTIVVDRFRVTVRRSSSGTPTTPTRPSRRARTGWSATTGPVSPTASRSPCSARVWRTWTGSRKTGGSRRKARMATRCALC